LENEEIEMKRSLLQLFAVAASSALLATGTFAQADPVLPSIPATMLITAEAQNGKQVPQIQQSDVIVMQDKQRDRVVSLQPLDSVQGGVQLFLLIDDGLSTSDLGSKLSELRSFLNSQPANIETGVAYMRNGAAMIAQNLTTDHTAAARSLRLPLGEENASASPYFSLQDLVKHWPRSNAAREVIMISDGIDPYWGGYELNDPYVNAAIEDVQKAGVVVNAIYERGAGHLGHTFWRITLGQSFLSEVADATGGEAYYMASESLVSFTPYLNQLSQRETHQYLLTFDAQPGTKPGLQPVKVRTEVSGVDLVGPNRVYVAAAR
jgi:hypothetical protein